VWNELLAQEKVDGIVGLTHKTFYKSIPSITRIKTIALFVVIGVNYFFGIV